MKVDAFLGQRCYGHQKQGVGEMIYGIFLLHIISHIVLTSSPRPPFSKGKQKLWRRVSYHLSPHSPRLILSPVLSRLAQRKMRITAGLPQKQARASPDKTPGCYPWVPVSCYGARDGWFPRNGVWNPARPRGLEVPVLCLRVWQSFHFFADFRPELFVKKPGKINNNLFFLSVFGIPI